MRAVSCSRRVWNSERDDYADRRRRRLLSREVAVDGGSFSFRFAILCRSAHFQSARSDGGPLHSRVTVQYETTATMFTDRRFISVSVNRAGIFSFLSGRLISIILSILNGCSAIISRFDCLTRVVIELRISSLLSLARLLSLEWLML